MLVLFDGGFLLLIDVVGVGVGGLVLGWLFFCCVRNDKNCDGFVFLGLVVFLVLVVGVFVLRFVFLKVLKNLLGLFLMVGVESILGFSLKKELVEGLLRVIEVGFLFDLGLFFIVFMNLWKLFVVWF